MSKLSIFMNEPLRAHELYQKEVHRIRMEERKKLKKKLEFYETENERLLKEVGNHRKGRKKDQEMIRQLKCQTKSKNEVKP